jgi:RNAse (barnase) inhibitor barstar
MGSAISNVLSIEIDCAKIVDNDTFHTLFAQMFGFPEFYGRNMNAWIDCMSSLDCPTDGMSKVHVKPGETLTLQLKNVADFKKRCPDLYDDIVECSAFVNWRLSQAGGQENYHAPLLALAFHI